MPTAYNQFINPFRSAYGSPSPGIVTGGAGGGAVPAPQANGLDPFGKVPGPLPMPTPAADLGQQYPNLTGTNAALSSDIYAKLNGYLSPSTTNAIQNHFGGTFGVKNGMPGSGLGWNNVY